MTHEAKPPQVEQLLALLNEQEVQFVIVGSVAARLYGVTLDPGDLDIVPATDRVNLERLIRVLEDLEARPPGPFGEWRRLSNGEWKWIARSTSEEEVRDWRPDAKNTASLDHLYHTRLGDFNVVPIVAGTYPILRKRANRIPAYRRHFWVAHVDEILARLTVPRREKDAVKVRRLREIQRIQRPV